MENSPGMLFIRHYAKFVHKSIKCTPQNKRLATSSKNQVSKVYDVFRFNDGIRVFEAKSEIVSTDDPSSK